MQVISIESAKPIFSYCPEIEPAALEQMKIIARLPFVRHCALMPDAHLGQNMPIGGVVACDNVVVCDFVGVDIGCGVCVLKTSLKKDDILDIELRKQIHASITRGVPMGFAHNNQGRAHLLRKLYGDKIASIFEKSEVFDCSFRVVDDIEKAIFEQLGTLGGGNHFISMEYDENDDVWIMLHSGSRNIGKKVCDHFNEIAKEANQRWHSVDTNDIGFLPVAGVEGHAYLTWMDLALKFAFLNRQVMMDEIRKDLGYILPNIAFDDSSLINIHHNYASLESHFGQNYWVHRKGAVLARKGHKGVIPGSMGTASYLTEGLGEEKSLCSSSHGAGRLQGRKSFNVEMNNEEGINKVTRSMEGIVYTNFGHASRGRDKGMLDISEAPQAYKSIENVMDNQKDLVKIIHKLTPLVNWKDSGEE